MSLSATAEETRTQCNLRKLCRYYYTLQVQGVELNNYKLNY